MKTLMVVAALSLLATSGCIVRDNGRPVPRNGTLVVDWTIDGSTDGAKCSESAADSIEVTVTDLNGDEIGTFDQSCDAFAESITLEPADYRASAVLVDVNGKPRTTAVPISRFSIFGDDELDIPIDFPADSFF
jgi:hypothetical protein